MVFVKTRTHAKRLLYFVRNDRRRALLAITRMVTRCSRWILGENTKAGGFDSSVVRVPLPVSSTNPRSINLFAILTARNLGTFDEIKAL